MIQQSKMSKPLPPDKNLVLFDGVCNLCNSSVQLIIKRDKKDIFRFASLQSDLGISLTNNTEPLTESSLKSIVLIESDGKRYTKSTAALRIARHLSGYSWLPVFMILPKFIRDFFYDLIARNRYRWFGRKDECMMPTPELQSKFLDV